MVCLQIPPHMHRDQQELYVFAHRDSQDSTLREREMESGCRSETARRRLISSYQSVWLRWTGSRRNPNAFWTGEDLPIAQGSLLAFLTNNLCRCDRARRQSLELMAWLAKRFAVNQAIYLHWLDQFRTGNFIWNVDVNWSGHQEDSGLQTRQA